MKAETSGESFETFGAAGKFGEDLHFDGAEESFGGPEGEAGLHDVIGTDGGRGDLGSNCSGCHACTFHS